MKSESICVLVTMLSKTWLVPSTQLKIFTEWVNSLRKCLLLGRKAMTNLDSILKSRDITLLTKVYIVKAMVFPIVMYWCKSWTIRKAEGQRTDAFELWSRRRLLESLVLQGDQTSQSLRKSTLNIHWKDWWWSWSSNNLATWWEELTH